MGHRGAAVRGVSAHLVWVACATVALWLGIAALLVGLRVDEESVVGAVVRWATWVDLPYVGRGADLWGEMTDSPTVRTFAAWGTAAGVWLVGGALAALLLRPRNG